ncbi:MarR family winged helix-turn-helix transcriptional regulator [Kibdelosporangium phytohabitans]|nr:MarR family transcriptional regulator [Kibdelosporangium phytohabitans]MBE1470372.1 DNA-binding MarR family transcriptional regulator [Kibdelosporangium phytohabitans]
MVDARVRKELIDYLFVLYDHVRADLKGLLHELDLTDAQAAALWRLSDEQEMTARQLADRLHCDASTASSMIDRLERHGVVRRVPHPTDRRAKILRLTPRGCELRDQLVRYTTERSPFAGLAPSDQRRLHALLSQSAAGR